MEGLQTRIQANIKREVMKLYKQRNGKGPDHVHVNIIGDLIQLKFVGAFSQIEKSLMLTDNGMTIVSKIRYELSQTHASVYFPVIEEIVQTRIKKSTYMMDSDNDIIYLFLLCEDAILTDRGTENDQD